VNNLMREKKQFILLMILIVAGFAVWGGVTLDSTAQTVYQPGIVGAYFNGKQFKNRVFNRNDAQINFFWSTNSPGIGIGADDWSVYWRGFVLPSYSETYEFCARSDDGVVLRVNNQVVVNYWFDQSATTRCGNINLTAGVYTPIELAFYDNTVFARLELYWSSPSQTSNVRTIIAPGFLYHLDDGDGISLATDNCPHDYNPNQEDFDGVNHIGDACEIGPFNIGSTPITVTPNSGVNADGSQFYKVSIYVRNNSFIPPNVLDMYYMPINITTDSPYVTVTHVTGINPQEYAFEVRSLSAGLVNLNIAIGNDDVAYMGYHEFSRQLSFVGPDVNVTATGLNDIIAGQTLIYSFTVDNSGAGTATNVDVFAGLRPTAAGIYPGIITHVVPSAGVELIQQGANGVTWVIPEIKDTDPPYTFLVYARSSSVLQLEQFGQSGQPVYLDVSIDAANDYDSSDNEDTVTTHIVAASAPTANAQDTKLNVTYVPVPNPLTASVGDTVTLQVTVENISNETLYNVEGFAALKDTFANSFTAPSILQFVWFDPSLPGIIPQGESVTATFDYTVTEAYYSLSNVTRSVWISADDSDPADGLSYVANSAELDGLTVAGSSLDMQLSSSRSSANIGDEITFTVLLQNREGSSDPVEISSITSQLTGELLANPITLQVEESQSVSFNYTVLANDVPSLTAFVTVDGVTIPTLGTGLPVEATAQRTISILPPPAPPGAPDLVVQTVTGSPTVAFRNTELAVPMRVLNDGESSAVDTVLRLTLPPNVDYMGDAIGTLQPSYDVNTRTLTWELSTLAQDAFADVTPLLSTDAGLGTSIHLTFNTLSSTNDANYLNNTLTLSLPIVRPEPTTATITLGAGETEYELVADGQDMLDLVVTVTDQLGRPYNGAIGLVSSNSSSLTSSSTTVTTDSAGQAALQVQSTASGLDILLIDFGNSVIASRTIRLLPNSLTANRSAITIGLGGTGVIDLALLNTASSADAFNLSVVPTSSNSQWDMSFAPASLALNTQQTGTSRLSIHVLMPEVFSPSECIPLLGTFNVTIEARNATTNALVDSIEVAVTVIAEVPQLSSITPADGALIGNSNVLFSWRSNTPAIGDYKVKIHYRYETESSYTVFDELEPNASDPTYYSVTIPMATLGDYFWYASYTNPCLANAIQLAERTLERKAAVSFSNTSYNFTIPDDYDVQRDINDNELLIGVVNADSAGWDVQVTLDNPYEDLIGGFIGSGSRDTYLPMNANTSTNLKLRVFTQETQQTTYTINAHLEAVNSSGLVVTDDVPITLTIQTDTLDLALINPALDPRTMVVRTELRNNGTTLTDLSLQVVDATTGIPANFVILPDVSHAYLPQGQSLNLQIIPTDVLDATQAPTENYVIRATSRNGTADLSFFDTGGTPLAFDLTQVCSPEKPRAHTCVSTPGSIEYESAGWYCTNRPNIDLTIPWTLNAVDVESISSINVTMDFAPGGFGVPYSHSTEMFFNNVSIGGDIVPDISQLSLNAPVAAVDPTSSYQTLNLRSYHTNSAHYTVASNAVVTVQYGQFTRTACYSDEELGDATAMPCGANGACELDITASQLRIERNASDPSLLDITIRVGNAGTIATLLGEDGYVPIEVAFYNGNPQNGSTLLTLPVTVSEALNPGEYEDVTVQLPLASTVARPLYVVVDNSQLYLETNEANNVYISNRYLSPDLTVTAVDASQMAVDANSLIASGVVTARIETPVQVTQPFNVIFFNDFNHNGQYDATDTVLQTVTKNSLTGSTTVSATVSGVLQFVNSPIYVMVDSGDTIIETDETNNVGISVSCLTSAGCATALPDISASHLVPTSNGSSTTLTVRIGNGGGEDVSSTDTINVTFYDGDPLNGGSPLTSGTVSITDGLAVGEYKEVVLNVALANLNIRPVWVVADDDGTQLPDPINGLIPESNELNNIYRSNIFVVDPVTYPNIEPVVDAGTDQQTHVGSFYLNASATDDGLPADTLIPIWSVFSGNADAVRFAPIDGIDTTVTFSEPGTYELQLTVSDLELEDSDTVMIEVLPPAPVPQPITTPPSCLVSPSQNDVVLEPVDIVVNQALTNASVFYWPITNVDDYVTLANGEALSANTTAATFDTTMLANDIYVIQVVGTDSNQTQVVCNVSVSVQGEYKPGRVVLSTVDFTVPVSGLPITIGRTYDSLERHYQSDFGYGWSLLIGSPRMEIDTSDNVTLTMPDGTRKTFYFAPQPFPLFSSFAAPQYLSEPGEYGTFRASSCNLIVRSGGQFFCFEGGRYSDNASAFTYEDPYGRIFTFSNDGELTSITDLNGNTLTFSETGITSSDGLSVYFNRDTEGRIIEACLDENNDSSCAGDVVYTYGYDGNGDLDTVHLPTLPNDPIDYDYYTTTGLEHFFLRGTDPNGNTAVQTVYDNEGRLAFVCDALVDTSVTPCGDNGNFTTAYTYSLETRSTTQTNLDGGVLTTTYDEYGNLESESGTAVAGTTTYDYDANNNLTYVENGEGQVTTYRYDRNGNRISVYQHIDANGDDIIDENEKIPVIRAVYNDYGAPTSLTGANGVVRNITYTAAGMPQTASDPLGEFGHYEWNEKGNPDEVWMPLIPNPVTEADYAITTYTYDPYGNVERVTEPSRPVFDGTSTVSPDNMEVGFTNDLMGRRTQTITYQANGTAYSTTDTTYDDLGRVTDVVTVIPDTTSDIDYDPDVIHTRYEYDANGNRTHVIQSPNDNVLRRTTRYFYDAANRVERVEYWNSSGGVVEATETEYDWRGNVETQTDAAGVKTCYTYNLAGQLTQILTGCQDANPPVPDEAHTLTVYKYDAAGRRTHTIQVDYAAYAPLNEQGKQDLIDNPVASPTTVTDYDDAGRVERVYQAYGTEDEMLTIYTYDDAGQLLSTMAVYDNTNPQSPQGHVTSYVYDIRGRRTQTIYPDGATLMTVYDNAGRVVRSVDAEQTETAYTYDPVGNLLTMTRGVGEGASIQSTMQYEYDLYGRRIRSIQLVNTSDPYNMNLNPTTRYVYDQLGRNTTTIDPRGFSTTAVYNVLGQIVEQIDARNNSTTYSYDALGRLTVTTYPDGTFSTTLYDDGEMKSVRSYEGGSSADLDVLTTYGYDKVGRLQTVIADAEGLGVTTTYQYDAFGRQAEAINAGTSTEYAYDFAGRMAQVTVGNPSAANEYVTTTYDYDTLGRRIEMVQVDPDYPSDPNRSPVTTYDYDSRGRMVSMTEAAGATDENMVSIARTTDYTYDAMGRRTSMTDALGHRTEYEYDPLGRLLLVRNPMGETVRYDYDVLGRMTTITDGNGNETGFAYNLRGEMTAKYWADYSSTDHHETYLYDANGNLIQHVINPDAVNPADEVLSYFEYDEMNRVTREVFGNDYDYRYTYTDRGELDTVSEFDGINVNLLTTYSYDSLSRPTTITHGDPQVNPADITYGYDAAGNRTSMDIEGTDYTYQYDPLNRVISVEEAIDPNGANIEQTTTFNYDAVGRLHQIQRDNDVNTTYTYDARNFLTNIEHENTLTPAILADYTYGYDLAGNRTSMTDVSGGVTTNITWDYDAANRLIEEHNDRNDIGYTTEYQYDQNGNRTREIRANGDIIRYSYNENDQLTSIQRPNYITENYEYDARGNLISTEQQQGIGQPVQTASYTYDARNKLTEATVAGAGTVNFEYDYAGRRTQQSIYAGDTTNYLWDEFSRFGDVVRETDELGAELMSYTLAGGMVISQTQGSTTHYLLGDALNSTRALTDSSGTVQGTFAYNAFGEMIEQTGTANTSYLYTGQQFDDVTGLYSLRARYYDPNVGRFLSRDTWAYNYSNPIELNRYGYVANNPVNWIDPSGYMAEYTTTNSTSGTVGITLKELAITSFKGAVAAALGYASAVFLIALGITIYHLDDYRDIGDIFAMFWSSFNAYFHPMDLILNALGGGLLAVSFHVKSFFKRSPDLDANPYFAERYVPNQTLISGANIVRYVFDANKHNLANGNVITDILSTLLSVGTFLAGVVIQEIGPYLRHEISGSKFAAEVVAGTYLNLTAAFASAIEREGSEQNSGGSASTIFKTTLGKTFLGAIYSSYDEIILNTWVPVMDTIFGG
jgi:RHS repeat-associated protein